jgi:hypothetical protein
MKGFTQSKLTNGRVLYGFWKNVKPPLDPPSWTHFPSLQRKNTYLNTFLYIQFFVLKPNDNHLNQDDQKEPQQQQQHSNQPEKQAGQYCQRRSDSRYRIDAFNLWVLRLVGPSFWTWFTHLTKPRSFFIFQCRPSQHHNDPKSVRRHYSISTGEYSDVVHHISTNIETRCFLCHTLIR